MENAGVYASIPGWNMKHKQRGEERITDSVWGDTAFTSAFEIQTSWNQSAASHGTHETRKEVKIFYSAVMSNVAYRKNSRHPAVVRSVSVRAVLPVQTEGHVPCSYFWAWGREVDCEKSTIKITLEKNIYSLIFLYWEGQIHFFWTFVTNVNNDLMAQSTL